MLALYHNDMSTCAQKVRFTLAEKGVEWEGHHMNLRKGEQQTREYLAMNPNGVVPTLVHDGKVIIESTVIMNYLEEAFPKPRLSPEDPWERAVMRQWMKKLDEGLHAMTGVLSSSVAFRYQHFAIKTEEEVRAQIERIPDEGKRTRQFENILKGLESKFLPSAVKAFARLIRDIDARLAEGPWLAGETFSLADMAYAPYMVRLTHLQMDWLWDDKPRVADWFARIQARPGFQTGLADWFNPNYISLMAEKGSEAKPKLAALAA
jgi:glutathione S-transferase